MKKLSIGTIFLLMMGTAEAQSVQDSLKSSDIEQIELFGDSKKQPKGLEIITRLPLKPRDQIQSISIISSKAIAEMGALTITDAAKNIPGVVLFSSYGGGAESMSIRGYRGTPTLKNGVLMNSDFRTSSLMTDMQGIESMQVIRGSAAITQGIGSALGAAGGVINLVTKRPRFYNAGEVGFRYGNWNMYRPTVDVQRVLDSQGKVAVRFNAAYQNNESFADFVEGERIYLNPSIAYRPDSKTEIVAEMDYLNNERTPNRGTVNLAADDTNAIYDMPEEKFLGFNTDVAKNKNLSFSTTIERKLTDHFKVRAAYMASNNEQETATTASLALVQRAPNITNYGLRRRSVSKSSGEDNSKVFQFDFVGQDVQTGILKHTFQLGFDWKESATITDAYGLMTDGVLNPAANSIVVDQIDVTQEVNNILPTTVDLNRIVNLGPNAEAKSSTIGLMAQEVMTIGQYVKAIMGIRYSKFNGDVQDGQKDAWDPQLGIMVSPLPNVNIYGSYTTTTSLRGNANPLEGGGTVCASVTRQWEAGVKSDWFDEKLRFNINLYDMDVNNLSYSILDAAGNATGLYGLAGDLRRRGVEVDLIGKLLPELEVMAGYAYLDAFYENSPAYVNDSRPMMAPDHTANAWLNYTVKQGPLTGLHFGGGVYYVGERPVNEYTQKVIVHNTQPGIKPFLLDAYTTLNAQVGYQYKNVKVKVFANNLTNSIGYSAYYRGGFLNRTDPRNFAVQLNYLF